MDTTAKQGAPQHNANQRHQGFESAASFSQKPTAADSAEQDFDAVIDITIPEAVLGGRVSVQAPAGRVVVGIPPRTSSGQRMRLKGKGQDGADWYVVTRIVVPRDLDSESEQLIRQFAMLNPDSVVD